MLRQQSITERHLPGIDGCFGGLFHFALLRARVSLPFRVPSKLTNGRADHKFGGENPLAEGHLRMVQSFKKHLHASFANLFLIDTDG
jgi:hypothetical protein